MDRIYCDLQTVVYNAITIFGDSAELWMDTPIPELDNRSPLSAIVYGDTDKVLTILFKKSSENLDV